jgi:hypothetical protein
MRASDMVIGDEYALSGRRAYLRVTVLETDPEVCGRGWVRVRFEEGILAGQEKRVPSESLPLARSVTVRRRTVCQAAPDRGPGAVAAGAWEADLLHKTGEIRWMVEEVESP